MSFRPLPFLAALLCLAGAGYYALSADRAVARRTDCAQSANRAEVEKSYAEEAALLAAGKRDEAVVALRRRVEKGPYPGAAHFLIGEAAYEQGAYGPAITAYRKAVETDPSLADRDAAFSAGKKILARVDALRKGPWAGTTTPETPHLHFLLRRLAGGCE